MLWWEWLLALYLIVIGPLVSYFWILSVTKNSWNGKIESTGTEVVNGKFVISNPKKFLPIFVILSIIGLPVLIIMLVLVVFIN